MSEENNTEKETILVINMFSGSFQVDNIAHEIINLFKTDDGEYYIYAPRDGSIGKERKPNSIKGILMVRRLNPEHNNNDYLASYEVIGRAFIDQSKQSKETDFWDKEQQEILLDKRLVYGYKSINEILMAGGRAFNIDDEKITFKASKCQRPSKTIVINCLSEKASINDDAQLGAISNLNICVKTNDGNKLRGLFGQNQKAYYQNSSSDSSFDPYRQLNRMFDDKEDVCWENFQSIKEINEKNKNEEKNQKPGARFLSLINKEDDEVSYSNMFAYFLDENRVLFERFIELLHSKFNIKNLGVNKFPQNIYREKKRADLWIDTKDYVFIIENKVNAPLDTDEETDEEPEDETNYPKPDTSDYEKGEKDDKYKSALKAYKAQERLKVFKEFRKKRTDNVEFPGGQLQRYVDAVLNELEKDNKEKDIFSLIICPGRHELFDNYKEYLIDEKSGKIRKVVVCNFDSKHDIVRKIPQNVPVVSYREFLDCIKNKDKDEKEDNDKNSIKCEDVYEEYSEVLNAFAENIKDYFRDFIDMLEWQERNYRNDKSKKFYDSAIKRFMRAIEIAKAIEKQK